MGNSASSQGSSTGTHDGDVGSSISEEQHDWPIEQAADTPDVQSLQEMRKPYISTIEKFDLKNMGIAVGIFSIGATELETEVGGNFTPRLDIRRCKNTWTPEG